MIAAGADSAKGENCMNADCDRRAGRAFRRMSRRRKEADAARLRPARLHVELARRAPRAGRRRAATTEPRRDPGRENRAKRDRLTFTAN
ncbi:hypothetical protein DZD18_16685 [Rhodobacteraceae bacterium W635]|nr:hypothetical protein DZD18_16685 [Rhodobacteraceae bacterium W635]